MVCIFGQAFLRLLEQIRVQEIGIGLGAQPIERIATVILREVGDDLLFVPLVPLQIWTPPFTKYVKYRH